MPRFAARSILKTTDAAPPSSASHPLRPPRELDIINLIRRQAADNKSPALRLGIGDDCAILAPPRGHDLLVTTDFSLEKRHFRRRTHMPESIAHRCLARGLSDLAAMGATPLAAFLSLALPAEIAADRRWLTRFLAGFQALATAHRTPLAGGDTSQSPANLILADIVLLGSAPRGRALRRDAARPGDSLYVTGTLGGAAAELRSLTPKSLHTKPDLSSGPDHPHLYPRPRLAVGQALLRRHLAHACIDLSDGLSTDLTHLCQASRLRAEIDAASLPLHPNATQYDALHGGEDYELLFTSAVVLPRKIAGIPITRIGTMLRPRKGAPAITLIEGRSRTALAPQGWEHFRK